MDTMPSVNDIFHKAYSFYKGNIDKFDTLMRVWKNSTDDEKIANIYNLLVDWNHLPSNYLYVPDFKNSTRAADLRNAGNLAFQRKQDHEALLMYTESIAVSPCSSTTLEHDLDFKELAVAFANRSAVLFSLKKYEGCLKDIEEALKYGYPDNLKYKLFERKAKCYHQMKSKHNASCALQEALKYLSLASLPEKRKEELELHLKSLQEIVNESHDMELEMCTNINKQCAGTLPIHSYGQNNEISSASDCICIKYNYEMGRYIESTRDIQPGDVLMVEQPYASVLLPDSCYTHCYNCLKRSQTLIPCLSCSMAMYCSEECRTESLDKSHKIECPLLPILKKLKIEKIGLLALQIIILASKGGTDLLDLRQSIKSFEETGSCDERMKGFNHDGQYNSLEYSTIYNLVGNSEKRSFDDLLRRALTAVCLVDCLEHWTNFFFCYLPKHENTGNVEYLELKHMVGGLLLRHLQNLPCNAHEVSEMVIESRGTTGELREIGAAAYATLSLVNHSCDPNVVRHSHHGAIAVMRAIRPIKAGQQILDNYGFHYAMHDVAERKSHLQTQYYFTCQCEPCLDNWPTYHKLPSSKPLYKCSKCGSALCSAADVETSDTIMSTCTKCQELNNNMDLTNSSKQFGTNLQLVLSGDDKNILPDLISYLILLDQRVQRPWKEYNDCQETIKYKLSLDGNNYYNY